MDEETKTEEVKEEDTGDNSDEGVQPETDPPTEEELQKE